MREFEYQLVDVFTDVPFGGNPLAVFDNAAEIPESHMQRIAKELNLSETTFVLPPTDRGNIARVRIFTPGMELPMAGHPTVGTAYVLARDGRLGDPQNGQLHIVFEEGVGNIPVEIEYSDNQPDFITMTQPLPEFGSLFEDTRLIADTLSIAISDIDERYPLEIVSCGVPFLFVPVVSLEAIQRINLRLDLWNKHLRNSRAAKLYVFTTETESAQNTVHSRMFAPGAGVLEDPATGSASGPLGCYLFRHKLISRDRCANITSEQGFEIGRPSYINISIQTHEDEITGVRVGGRCVSMGRGVLYLRD